MHTPTAADLLNVWESARGLRPFERSLALLALVADEADIATWSLGKRDSYLLTLRERLFGAHLSSVTSCPNCASRLEMDFSVGDIRAPFAQDEASELQIETTTGSLILRLRPIQVQDIEAVASNPQAETLLKRCLVEVHSDDMSLTSVNLSGVNLSGDLNLPTEVSTVIAAHLAELDPQADVQLSLRCADCGHSWTTPFDIGIYLWREVESWAMRLLREVHTLAWAYGWSESEILALSPQRRQAYLEMVMG